MVGSISLAFHAFENRVASSVRIVSATEALWLTAPPTSSVRRQLTAKGLEALYESAFLRAFSAWEAYLERVTTSFMVGHVTRQHTPTLVPGRRRPSSMANALRCLLADGRSPGNPRDFLLWYNPNKVEDRVRGWLVNSPVEVVCHARRNQLTQIAIVRHHIAHGTTDSKRKFCSVAVGLSGSEYDGVAGRFLRADDITDPLNRPRWIVQLVNMLRECASLMAT